MNGAAKDKETSDLSAITDDIAALKRDLGTLIEHLRSGAIKAGGDTAREAVGQISEEAQRLYRTLASEGERSAKALEKRVEEQPLISVLIAFGLGFIGGRLLSR